MIILYLDDEIGKRISALESGYNLARSVGTEVVVIWEENEFFVKYSEVFGKIKRIRIIRGLPLKRMFFEQLCKIKLFSFLEAFWYKCVRILEEKTFCRLVKYYDMAKGDKIDLYSLQKVAAYRNVYLHANNAFFPVKEKLEIKYLKNQDTTNYWVIVRRVNGKNNGIYSYLQYFLPYIEKIADMGASMVIDMQHYANVYVEKEMENAWEYFFCQPYNKNLDEICGHSNMLFSDYLPGIAKIDTGKVYKNDISEVKHWNAIYRRFIHLNKEMEQLVETEYQKLRAQINGKKILGVKFRGTDYRPENIPYGHAFQYSAEEMLKEVIRVKKDLGEEYEYIYLAVEEEEALKLFQNELGDKVIFYNCQLINSYDIADGSAAVVQGKLVGKRRAGIDYIVTIELLSRCDSLMCSANSGALMSIIMNGGKFERIISCTKERIL